MSFGTSPTPLLLMLIDWGVAVFRFVLSGIRQRLLPIVKLAQESKSSELFQMVLARAPSTPFLVRKALGDVL